MFDSAVVQLSRFRTICPKFRYHGNSHIHYHTKMHV
nr:MAG TPA: hypothetical protein [Caudoviricetes sp.]